MESISPLPDLPGEHNEVAASTGATSTAGLGRTGTAIAPVEFTEDAIAAAFTARHHERMLYVGGWGRWYIWDGARWQPDRTGTVLHRAREVCRGFAAQANRTTSAVMLSKAATVDAVERLARADPRHARTTDIWDADAWLLNTPGGVVDLRTGAIRPHDPNLHMTKLTAVGPDGECPTWIEFLDRVTGGNAELIGFLQRVAGYSLTGSTREHALFFAFGSGANGKSVFLNTLLGIMGDYAAVAPMDAFTASAGDRHPTDLAGLRGARLVTSQEIDEGEAWAEARIKALTGGDPISARFMRQDFFTYAPQFKLLIAGNHKPRLRNVDDAIRRRLNLIPFAVTIPPDERDPELFERLKAEWPGILRWMVQGCLNWQRDGLAHPSAVIEATGDYLEMEDTFTTWLDERCKRSPGNFESSADLFTNWKSFAGQAGEDPGNQKRFAERMKSRGFVATRRQSGTVRGFQDVEIIRANYSEGLRYGE